MQKIKAFFSCFIAILLCSTAHSQAGFSDDFTDGDFSSNPAWIGETGKFQVNVMNQLQLNDAGATSNNEAYLVTNSAIINDASWEFYVKLDFDPSTSNFAKVYLVSDNQTLTQSLNGYFVRVGGASGTVDDISLYRQDGGSEIKIIDGADGTAANSPELKIRVTKSNLNEWELFTDATASGSNYQSEGTVTDNTYGNSSFFGVFCKYTSTRSDKFTFDDFVVNGVSFQDTIKPRLNSATVINDSTVSLSFTEALDNSAENESNYIVNKGIGNPDSAFYTNNDSSNITITFGTFFTNGEEYELIVKNINDRSGNAILEDTVDIFYFVPIPAEARDVVINELFPDPTPSVGLPESEFIELHNTSDKVFELENWTITDGSSTASLPSKILRPNQHLIICNNSVVTQFEIYGTTLGVSSLPSLNNAGDNVVLRDASGKVIDFVNYTDEWYKDPTKENGGYTLEQINPIGECTGINNFTASNSSIGGTPGQQNSVFDTLPDAVAPNFIAASVLSSSSILLTFDEPLDSSSVSTSAVTFTPSLTVSSAVVHPPSYESILITLTTPLVSGTIYQAMVNGVTDCSGNSISNQNSRTVALPGVANKRDVVVNELYPDAEPSNGLPQSEFIELFNSSEKVFELDGWTISDGASTAQLTPYTLLPNEYVIFCNNTEVSNYQAFGTTIGVSSLPSLNNAGDNIELKDETGRLIDFVYYTDEWYNDPAKDGGGYTLEQKNPFTVCSGANNFSASNDLIGGTPGQQNSVFDTLPDIDPPSLADALLPSKDSVILRFDESIDSTSAGISNFVFTPDLIVAEVINQAPLYESVIIILATPLDSGIIYNLQVNGVKDCSGNDISDQSSIEVALPDVANEKDVVINEILFNPRTGGVDFVEFFNRSQKVISLEKWIVANKDDTIANPEIITTEPFLLLPGEYLVITEDKENILFEYPLSRADRIMEIVDLPSYNDNEGTVYILNSNYLLIDAVSYTDDQHFPLLADDEGVSLERISPERPSDDKSNFHSASESVGFATPGYQNSQFFNVSGSGGKISIEPDIFSPDNDGFQDVVTISYQFSEPGFVANVDIFDRNGRKVKSLVKNELLGSSGSFSWDGITDENSKARIGPYVVLIDAFNPNGNKEVFKGVVVVASQLD